jgi:hypothetical protein
MSRDADARTSAMESRDGPFSPDVQTRRTWRARDNFGTTLAMKARHGPPHVGTVIWTNRAAPKCRWV